MLKLPSLPFHRHLHYHIGRGCGKKSTQFDGKKSQKNLSNRSLFINLTYILKNVCASSFDWLGGKYCWQIFLFNLRTKLWSLIRILIIFSLLSIKSIRSIGIQFIQRLKSSMLSSLWFYDKSTFVIFTNFWWLSSFKSIFCTATNHNTFLDFFWRCCFSY